MRKIVEDTTSAAADGIATTDENLSVNAMYQQTSLPSLGRQIFSVIPLNGPTGAIFNIKRKTDSNDFELIRNDVEVYPSVNISTGLTNEVIQDLYSQYGKEHYNIIGTLLRGLSNEDENAKTLAFLEANSKDASDLQLSDSLNAETSLFEIMQRTSELVLKMNSKNLRTYESCVVLPYIAASSLLSLNKYIDSEGADSRGLYAAKINKTKIYINPDPTSTTSYVVLKDLSNPSKSSAIFSPYVSEIKEAINSDNGNLNYFIVNRYAITASPLHETDNELMYKFTILT